MEASSSSAGFLLLIGVFVAFMATPSQGYVFYVGGKDGWVASPSEDYGHWAEKNRFQINDTLVFKYKKGENSVLVVSKEDYDSCNDKSPIAKLDGGDSTFTLVRSGPFFFISGVPEDCKKGQKLHVVVLSHRQKTPTVPPAPVSSPPAPSHPPVPSPSPSSSPSAPSPPPAVSPPPASAHVPVPSHAPSPPSISPEAHTPPPSPPHSPETGSPSPSPSPPEQKSASTVITSSIMLVVSMALGALLL